MTRLILGLLLGLLLGAPATVAAESFPNLTPRVTPAERFAHDLQARHDRLQQHLNAEAQLSELRLLRMSIDQQTQALQQQHQRELRRRLWEGE